MDAGYFYGYDVDDAGAEHSIFVLSCGHYQLIRRQEFETLRREGRQDWQLLYVAGGKAHFYLADGERTLKEGEAFIYPPGQPQRYRYFLHEKPDIYWLHFTGEKAQALLDKTGLPSLAAFCPGFHGNMILLFDRIIRELQQNGLYGKELASAYAQALFYLLSRGMSEKSLQKDAAGPEILKAVEWMHKHPEESSPMTEYAQRANMSLSTFIRRFRAHTGVPPQRYVTRLRMTNARELMDSTTLPIADIARLVGYDNPLYFSRMFKKETGMSPRAYRQASVSETGR
jgi:AraC-like DNA-binding protein